MEGVLRVRREGLRLYWFFFFKQKTAYEVLGSLVGSEMCIRDGLEAARPRRGRAVLVLLLLAGLLRPEAWVLSGVYSVSYTHLTLPTIHSV